MTVHSGKTWFRDNISPYLTKIKAEMATVGGSPPIVYSTDVTTIPINTVVTITVTGDFFTPAMTITCPTATISNYVFLTQQSCTFDITTTTAQNNVISYTTSSSVTSDILSTVSAWTDLRTGGDAYTETHDPGTTVTQDAEGLWSNGSLWSNWLKITSASWNRTNPKRVSFVLKTGGTACMFGIMGNEQDENATAQYYQAEIYAYVPSTYVWGFYGTNAAHAGASSTQTNVTINAYPYTKIEFQDNGEAGSTFKIFGLSDLTDFDDESNLLGTWTVGVAMTADSTTLYPCCTTGSINIRFVAFKVEDM